MDLLKYNSLGLIPGPEENEQNFQQRVAYCLKLKEDFSSLVGQQFKFQSVSMPQDLESDVDMRTKDLFDISVDWVPLVFSNYKLAPWHGGCAWIFQMSENTPTGAFFQLRDSFAKKSRYLGIYDREEIIAHESAHVGRMLFQEPKFEEILAYRTSHSWFRRWFGPIIQSSLESFLILIVIMICIFLEFFSVAAETSVPFGITTGMEILALGLFAFGVMRLWRRQKQFDACLKVLEDVLKDKRKANAVIYRLQDKEIIAFGKMTSEGILEYAKQHQKDSIRWRVIAAAYFVD